MRNYRAPARAFLDETRSLLQFERDRDSNRQGFRPRTPIGSRPRMIRRAMTLVELLVVFAVIALLVGMLLPAVQNVRGAAARSKCQNNLRQLGIALHQSHDANNALPPGHRSLLNPERLPFSGWTLVILPYVEQPSLYDQARAAYAATNFPFANPPHTGLSTVVVIFNCPSDSRVASPQISQRTRRLVAFTSYLGVSGRDYSTRDGVLYQDSYLNLLAITDGTSNTLMLGERPPSTDFQFGWWYAGVGQRLTGSADLILGVREENLQLVTVGSCAPGRYPFRAGRFDNQCDMFHFWSPHTGGANFALADGSVRFISYSANPIMPALASRAGGEAVAVPD